MGLAPLRIAADIRGHLDHLAITMQTPHALRALAPMEGAHAVHLAPLSILRGKIDHPANTLAGPV